LVLLFAIDIKIPLIKAAEQDALKHPNNQEGGSISKTEVFTAAFVSRPLSPDPFGVFRHPPTDKGRGV
jgi:hypothetical protein